MGSFVFGGFNGLREFTRSPNPAHHRLTRKYEQYTNFGTAFGRANAGELVMLESESFANFIIRRDFSDR